jgi:hypothetical protein
MPPAKLTTPVLFLVFNRPATTKVVFEAIRSARPARLYIAADGPRKSKADEVEKCNEVRSIVSNIDWDCEVKTLFREENLGCGKGVSSGITWFFENEIEGIILEDDCVPDPTFFPYCTELLQRFRDDNRVMEISGNSTWPEEFCHDYSYSFSNHNSIWGWATWRRAWNLYDYEMKNYEEVIKSGVLEKTYSSIFEKHYFNWVFERTYRYPHITWDYQWEFIKRVNSGLTVIPKRNLIVNIGYGSDATSTHNPNNPGSNLKSMPIEFPLIHPPYVLANIGAERQAFIDFHTNMRSRIISHIKNFLPKEIEKRLFKKSMNRFIKSQEKKS